MTSQRARPSRATPWLLAGSLLVLTAWFFPYFPELGSPNELTRLYLTRAIVDDASFSIDGPVQRYGRINDLAGHEDRLYSDKAPGVGVLGVPVYILRKAVAGWDAEDVSNPSLLRWLRFFLAGLPTAAIALLLFHLLGQLELDRRSRLALMMAYGLATVAFPYGVLLFGHQLCTAFLVGAFALVDRDARAPGWINRFGTGFLLGCALLSEYTSLLLVVPLAAWALVASGDRPRTVAWGLAGSLLPLGLLALYHSLCFGGPLSTGYAHLVHRSFAEVHERGLWGMVAPGFGRLVTILFSSNKGLFFYSPWLILGVIGLAAGAIRPKFGRWRSAWIALASASVLYLVFSMSLQLSAWGWSVGPRHLCPLVPFWVLAAGALLRRSPPWPRWVRRALWVLVPPSMVAIVLPTATFGGFPPDFSNPLADFSVPLLLTGCLPASVGTSLGLSPGWGALPFWLATLAFLVWLGWDPTVPRRERLITAPLAAAAVALLVSVQGAPDPREQRSLEWVQQDILKCVDQTGWDPPG